MFKSWLLLVVLSTLLVTLGQCGSTRRSEGSKQSNTGKEVDTPFWAARGKRTPLRCAYYVKEETDEESSGLWPEVEASSPSSNDLGSTLDSWHSRMRRNSPIAYVGGYTDKNSPKRLEEVELLQAMLRMLGKRNTNAGTKDADVPFWAARG